MSPLASNPPLVRRGCYRTLYKGLWAKSSLRSTHPAIILKILLTITQIRTIFRVSPCHHEGRCANVTQRGAGCDGRLRRQVGFLPDETFAAYGEIVWSWRRDPGATLAGQVPASNGGKKGRSPGRVRISRKAIARGKPGCLGCTCQTRVRSFYHCTRWLAGAVGARLSLRPLFAEGQRNCKTRARIKPRE